MNRDEVLNLLHQISIVYGKFDIKAEDKETFIDIWLSVLEEYPVDTVKKAFKETLKTCAYAPKPADIVSRIESKSSRVDDWNAFTSVFPEIRRCLDDMNYDNCSEKAEREYKEIKKNLPESIKKYIGDNSLAQYTAMTDYVLNQEKKIFINLK